MLQLLINELSQGTPIFKVQDDGTETVEFKPPTSKELRALRAISGMINHINHLNFIINGGPSDKDLHVSEQEISDVGDRNDGSPSSD